MTPPRPGSETTRLTCHAPHRDPAKKGEPCGAPLGAFPGQFAFVTTAERLPETPDAYAWLRCPRSSCGLWNKFEIVAALALVPATPPAPAPVRTLEERLGALPEDQQLAVQALAGGITVMQTARLVGVDRKTIQRWNKEPEFVAIRRAIAPQLTGDHVRVALNALLETIDKDRKKGVAHNARWFLTRTVFADFERARAAAGGTNVSVQVQQQQQMVSNSVREIWEKRRTA